MQNAYEETLRNKFQINSGNLTRYKSVSFRNHVIYALPNCINVKRAQQIKYGDTFIDSLRLITSGVLRKIYVIIKNRLAD